MVGASVGRQHHSRTAPFARDGDKVGAFASSLHDADLAARYAGITHQSEAEPRSSRRQLRRSVGHTVGVDVQASELHLK